MPSRLRSAAHEVAHAEGRTPPARASAGAEPAQAALVGGLAALQAATQACRDCPIGFLGTRSVVGEGPQRARLMLVGEQPGDQEERRGRPFTGPAGHLLDRALIEAGIARNDVFITNAVKHFKFELRGKRRIHKSPGQREAEACLKWLDAEIALTGPSAFVALGARAARSLLGAPVAILKHRGQWLDRADGRPVLVTFHPSALLRLQGSERESAFGTLVHDLRMALSPPRLGGH
jgi:uracil-DNA glycosylase